MVSRVHVIDPDVRRRAQVSRELHSQPLHVEIYESIDEFVELAPTEGFVLLADDADRAGGNVSQLAQQSEVRLPVVAYAEAPTSQDVVEAMLAGALGYLEWPFDHSQLDPTLSRMGREAERIVQSEQRKSAAKAQVEKLSRREKQVLEGLISGMANKDIAEHLSISARTVEIHRSKMMLKLGARSVADAVRIGLYAGLDEERGEPPLP